MTLVVLEVEQFPKVLNFSGSVCQKPAAVAEGSSAFTCSPRREERPKCRTNQEKYPLPLGPRGTCRQLKPLLRLLPGLIWAVYVKQHREPVEGKIHVKCLIIPHLLEWIRRVLETNISFSLGCNY